MSPAAQNLLFFALLIVGFYLLAIRPQRKRAQELARVRAQLAPGTQVMTTAGLFAYVADVEGDNVVLEIAPGVKARFATAAVVRIVDPTPSVEGREDGSTDAAPPDAPPAQGGTA